MSVDSTMGFKNVENYKQQSPFSKNQQYFQKGRKVLNEHFTFRHNPTVPSKYEMLKINSAFTEASLKNKNNNCHFRYPFQPLQLQLTFNQITFIINLRVHRAMHNQKLTPEQKFAQF